ncbi:class I SAM-dependent methyltransferase [Deefgea rivuli]|uniref:class I SAM-dependent methyltransferase n=1 Tax=Deefgea rivuli TaxID=400948 RepID=UPI000489BD4C|nr:class I SAM-dependent methyltransferase [Deefgea rivuli]
MSPTASELTQITALTLAHYAQSAIAFRDGTAGHDVSQNIAALLRHLPSTDDAGGVNPLHILDFGCGPGRDLKAFTALGHCAVGLDGTSEFAQIARAETTCTVWQQDFLQLDLPTAYFDGVYANASLFHIPSAELARVLRQLHATLKTDGVLFSSNPRGNNQEGWSNGRYGAYHDLAQWRCFLNDAGFSELEHYYRPTGLPREQQPWLASVWRKVD